MKKSPGKRLTLNKASIQILDDQNLVNLKGGLAGPISWERCITCIKPTSCGPSEKEVLTGE